MPKQLLQLLSISFMLFSFAAQAKEKLLCLVTNDIDKETGKMVYEMDEESRTIKHLYKERYLNDKLIERVEMDPKELLGEGIILHRKDKFITVRLYSYNFDETRGGVLYLDTLYNGVTGERKEYPIEVSMNGEEATMYYSKAAFNRMHFVAKRNPVLGVIGVGKVNFSK